MPRELSLDTNGLMHSLPQDGRIDRKTLRSASYRCHSSMKTRLQNGRPGILLLLTWVVGVSWWSLASESNAEAWPWVAYGQVTDANGQGIPGVTIRASCGLGTLMGGGHTTTDAQGSYRLRFGPGMVVMDDSNRLDAAATVRQTALQAAVITAWKPGYYEKNLSRQGDLMMSGSPANSDKSRRHSPERVILPNKPRQIDFVMLPAASISGRVTDPTGASVTGQRFYVDGDELGPAASVLGEFRSGEEGTFEIQDVPCKTYWFTPADGPLRDLKSNSLTFAKPGRYDVVLSIDRSDGRLEAKIIKAPEY